MAKVRLPYGLNLIDLRLFERYTYAAFLKLLEQYRGVVGVDEAFLQASGGLH